MALTNIRLIDMEGQSKVDSRYLPSSKYWTPEVANPTGWYVPTSVQTSGINVTQWSDISGYNNHLSLSLGTPTFVDNSVNFSSNAYLENTTATNLLSSTGSHLVVMVFDLIDFNTLTAASFQNLFQLSSTATTPANRRPWFFYAQSGYVFRSSLNATDGAAISLSGKTPNTTLFASSYVTASGTFSSMYFNGVFVEGVSISQTTSTTLSSLRIGLNSSSQGYNHKIREVLIIPGTIDLLTKQKVDSYFSVKYNIPITNVDHPYYINPALK